MNSFAFSNSKTDYYKKFILHVSTKKKKKKILSFVYHNICKTITVYHRSLSVLDFLFLNFSANVLYMLKIIQCALYEPHREKNLFIPYANNKGTDQLAHPRSLISTFVIHCLDSIISLVSTSEISSL